MLKQEIEKKEHDFIPYTTVMSTMTTLAEKKLLKQDKTAKTYIYSAAVNNKELSKSIIKSVSEKLLENSASGMVSRFLSDSKNLTKSGIEKLMEETAIPLGERDKFGAGLIRVDGMLADAPLKHDYSKIFFEKIKMVR